jgi:predicted nuclease of predicted toxin-antitoxin system
VKVWLDAHLAPGVCAWLASEFGLEARPLGQLGLRDADDSAIFEAAGAAGAVIMSKDADFADLVTRLGPPPAVLWLTCGNTTNAGLREFLGKTLGEALQLIQGGEPLVRLAVAPAS